MRAHHPLDRAFGRTCGNQGTNDKPSVIVLGPAVEQSEFAPTHRLDRHALPVRLRSDGDPRSVPKRVELIVAVGGGTRTIGLPGEDSRLTADLVGLPEENSRIELKVESNLPNPRGRQRLVEVHDNPESRSVRLDLDHVAELQVRIADRVQALAILALVRIGHADADLLGRAVDLPPAHGRGWLPLAGSRVEPKVAVGSDPLAVQDHPHASLVSLGIEIVRQHDVQTGHLEVFLVVDRKRLGRRLGCGGTGVEHDGQRDGRAKGVSDIHGQ